MKIFREGLRLTHLNRKVAFFREGRSHYLGQPEKGNNNNRAYSNSPIMEHTGEGKVKLIIADDHAVVREVLIQILLETFDLLVIAEVENGNDLPDRFRKIQADVVLTDIGVHRKRGWDMLIQLKAKYPRLPVIVMTLFPEKDLGNKSLKAGESAYLHTANSPEEIVEVIRKVARGGRTL
jgi:CheY-like chemotaxis protein